jgi:hypothetical protein
MSVQRKISQEANARPCEQLAYIYALNTTDCPNYEM